MTVQAWKTKGRFEAIYGKKVFVVDTGGNKPVLAISHGYPTASYDYYKVLDYWTPHFRVIVHDHLGFGLSEKPKNYSYSLIEQADIALKLWQQLGVQEAYVLGHDYGTSVLTEVIARRNQGTEPIKLLSATLGNGSMLIEMSQLLLSQKLLKHPFGGPKLAKLSSRAYFRYNMRKIWWDKSKFDVQEIDDLWDMLIAEGGRDALPKLTQYINDRYKFWHRWISGGLYQTDLPINLLWADKDPVAVIGMAHELHKNIPNNQLKILPNIGHYPMLEAPKTYANAVLEMVLRQ